MSVTSNRSVTLNWTGDVEYTQEFPAIVSPTGSGQNQLVALGTTSLTVTVPTNCVAVTLVPPVGNTTGITLKGSTTDTGISLNLTDPSSFGLATTQTTIVLVAATTLTGTRLLFS